MTLSMPSRFAAESASQKAAYCGAEADSVSTPGNSEDGSRPSGSTNSTSSSSNSTPVNKQLKAQHLRVEPSTPLSLHTSGSFGSQLQDSDFAPGQPLRVWGNNMFDDDDECPSSPPLSPNSATATMRYEDQPAVAALRCTALTPMRSFGQAHAPSAAARAAVAALSPRPVLAESPAVPSTSTEAFSDVAVWESRVRQMLACSSGSGSPEEALRLPAPTGSLVRAYVKRVKGRLGSGYSYQMLLEDGDVPLLAAKRHTSGPGATYLIGAGCDAPRRESESLSKLKSNFMGTEFVLSSPSPSAPAAEELCVHFRTNGLTVAAGPRTMNAVFPTAPSLSSAASCSSVDGAAGGAGGLSAVMAMAKDRTLPASLEREVAMVSTKPPEYDEATGTYSLHFAGRKLQTSKKNHQLVCWDHRTDRVGAEVLLQLGKLADSAKRADAYALDFAYPLNIHTAFALALANLDDKLCFKM